MATVNYYLSRFIKNDDERGEIQLRFSGNRNFVKRAPTGIFITAGNWDPDKGMPRCKRISRYGDNCDEIRDRLNLLTSFLLRCWEDTSEDELKPDTLTMWLDDIEWSTDQEVVYINGKPTAVNIWKVDSKARMAAEAAMRKRENAKFENWFFLDAFKFYIDEQLKNGVITEVRHKTYYTCWGIWDRMQKYKGKQYRVRDVTTADLFDFRHFIINECDLWETKEEKVGIYKKCQKIGRASCRERVSLAV